MKTPKADLLMNKMLCYELKMLGVIRNFFRQIFSWPEILKNAGPYVASSEDYAIQVDILDNVVRECSHVSKKYGGIPSPSVRHYYASLLFTVLCTRASSIAILMPNSPWAQKIIENWDYASIANLTRSVIEVRAAFYYLCIDDCEESEWKARWNLFNLHDCCSRKRLFEESNPGHEDIEGFEKQAEELRARLKKNPFFVSLPLKQQMKFIKGKDAYYLPLEDICEKAGLDKSTFRWMWQFFSNHIHALPMSFYRVGDEDRGRGIASPVEEGYISLCLSLVAMMMVKSRDELHILFSDLTERPLNDLFS